MTVGALLGGAWARWKVIAQKIGNVQARVLLSLFYFVVVPPFALIVKGFSDPLGLRAPQWKSSWVERRATDAVVEAARRQF